MLYANLLIRVEGGQRFVENYKIADSRLSTVDFRTRLSNYISYEVESVAYNEVMVPYMGCLTRDLGLTWEVNYPRFSPFEAQLGFRR